jgi:hypothetical protein
MEAWKPTTKHLTRSWERVDRDDARLIFTENVGTLYIPLETLNWTGTYTYDDNKITVTLDQEKSMPIVMETYGDSFTSAYKFEDGLLILGTFPSTAYRKATGNS